VRLSASTLRREEDDPAVARRHHVEHVVDHRALLRGQVCGQRRVRGRLFYRVLRKAPGQHVCSSVLQVPGQQPVDHQPLRVHGRRQPCVCERAAVSGQEPLQVQQHQHARRLRCKCVRLNPDPAAHVVACVVLRVGGVAAVVGVVRAWEGVQLCEARSCGDAVGRPGLLQRRHEDRTPALYDYRRHPVAVGARGAVRRCAGGRPVLRHC
jgi:hypothetical protein